MRIAYLGPEGTFSEDALRSATGGAGTTVEPLPVATVLDAFEAVAAEEVGRALVPFENSTDGSVRATLDALAFDAPEVTIVGEHDEPISLCLVAAEEVALDQIELVVSHPQPLAQCAGFLRRELRNAVTRAAASSAEAVREVRELGGGRAAVGTRGAADIYGCVVLRDRIEDSADNVTRFIWVARAGVVPEGEGNWKTSLCFSELGADHPGALVEALREFSDRDVNLTRIESRPLRRGLGRYMFFVDLEGAAGDVDVAEALAALRGKAEQVRILGSYPTGTRGVPGLASGREAARSSGS